ncbi:YesL family protein [Sporosarcina gallistercoris]|uniref:DUF624 domain-containing protein n=1 Tax=Sporosarcina gallistercoris TaxID=2762245 RepID=A0ABR8PJ64_9BACL|nr:DUF624 domain-containing protein [Sporosarcina gallistercoris]MBD7908231.1 DUF624 domain-containing protein [Sporosarcina gallistercoris]
MPTHGWKAKLYQFVEFVTMLAVLQLMWIGMTIMGLVIVGITPATVGLFITMRKRLRGQEDLKTLVKIYWKAYKEEFIASNKIGLVLIGIGYFLVVNFRIVTAMPGTAGLAMLTIMVMIMVLYALIVMNIFQVFAHYELPFTRYFSTSVLLTISFPLQGAGSIVGLYLLYRVFLIIPGLLPFFGISVTILFLTWMSSKIFKMKGEMDGTLETENGIR